MTEELSNRISELRNSFGTPDKIDRLTASTVSPCSTEHEEVNQIKKEIKSNRDRDGQVQLMHRFWADIDVSESAAVRTFELLNRFVHESKLLGIKFNLSTEPKANNLFLSKKGTKSKRGYFEIYDERFFIRIKEKILTDTIQVPIEKTNSKRSKTNFPASIQNSGRTQTETVFTPTGKLYLSIRTFGFNYEIQKIEDTPSSDIESKLTKMLVRLEIAAATGKVEGQIREEQSRDRERKRTEWQERKTLKDSILKKISECESIATSLDRSESLKRLIKKIENHPSPPKSLLEDLDFLKKAADWLDPLSESRWSEIDDVPDRNPYSLYY